MVQILRSADLVPMPWKNGGGLTRELAMWPPAVGLDELGWRISLATVSRGGPFSMFPGVDRALAVIQGELHLVVEGGPDIALGVDSAPIHFPGDVPVHGAPNGAAVIDLNVMTRRDRFTSRMTRVKLTGNHPMRGHGVATFVIALHPTTFTCAGIQHLLKPQDAVCVDPQDGEVIFTAKDANCILVEILGQQHA